MQYARSPPLSENKEKQEMAPWVTLAATLCVLRSDPPNPKDGLVLCRSEGLRQWAALPRSISLGSEWNLVG